MMMMMMMNSNSMIRGYSMVRVVRINRGPNNRFRVQVAHVSEDHLQYRVLVGGLGNYLMKSGRDVK